MEAESDGVRMIQDLVLGCWRSQVLFSAIELGVFDALADGSQTSGQIAGERGFSETAGRKLLAACCALGLLEKQGHRFSNTEASRNHLVKGKPGYMGDLVMHIYRDVMPLWNKLTDAVIENHNRWEQVTGSLEGHFANLYKDPARLETFLGTMHLYNLETAQQVARVFDFGAYSSLLDVGGATGIFGHVVHEYHPRLRVTVADLAEVCRITKCWIRDKYKKETIMNTVVCDFLNDPLPKGYDLIYLGWVLHDWSDAVQRQLLHKCFEALPGGGAVLATETLMDETGDGPLLPALLSLDMLVSTDGGSESTASELMERFHSAGFVNVRVKSLPGMRDLIIGEKT